MENVTFRSEVKQSPSKPGRKTLLGSTVALAILAGGALGAFHFSHSASQAAVAVPPPSVTVSAPVQREIDARQQFLGQLSAVENLEIRAQVGGTLTQIGFKDGDIVHKGDLLFQIDPTPYEIKFSEASAQLKSAHARLDLAARELARAETLEKTGAGSSENTEQRIAEKRAAEAAVDNADALVRDAKFDLDHTRITAPFTGHIGTHQVSVGNLISGSRAGAGPTTLLGVLVSTDSVYLNFDMSEADYLAFQHARQAQKGALANKVELSLGDENSFERQGTLDFIDNSLDRSSGTIHARATVPNTDQFLTPGAFARVRLQVAAATPALLVPDAAVLPDQGEHVVLTVGANNVVTPKHVQVGDLRGGLRVIRGGLNPDDLVVIGGIPAAHPGSTVAPQSGTISFNDVPSKG